MFPARIKQFIVSFILFSLLLQLIPSPVYANNLNPQSSTNTNVPNNMHVNVQVILIELSSAFICQLVGVDIIDPSQPCLSIDPATRKIGRATNPDEEKKLGGALGAVVGLITSTYNVPVHTSDYTRYMASQFGVVKSAYAQGAGFNGLKPLMVLWQKIRDLTYTAFVLMFVMIGFSIMLRVKIDPRTVMSIQNQIPRIVIAILLITMSYAIVGFIIDAMWVTTYTGINLLTNNVACQDAGTDLGALATNNLLSTPFHYVNRVLECPMGFGPNMADLSYRVGLTLGDILTSVLSSFLGNTTPPSNGCRLVGGNLLECFEYLQFEFTSFLIGIVATLAIAIAILVQLTRLWFELLKAYIYIILYTLTGPVWILLGLFPGTTTFGFANWLRHVLFAVSIYPATVFLFVVAAVLASNTDIRNPLTGTNQMFNPPLVANPSIDNNMGYILALGAILISPQIINMMREAFKSPASKHSAMIYAGLGVGAAGSAAMGKAVFGKRKDGSWGPGTYYARRIPIVRKTTDKLNEAWKNLPFNKASAINPKFYTGHDGRTIVDYGKDGGLKYKDGTPVQSGGGGSTGSGGAVNTEKKDMQTPEGEAQASEVVDKLEETNEKLDDIKTNLEEANRGSADTASTSTSASTPPPVNDKDLDIPEITDQDESSDNEAPKDPDSTS